MSNVVLPSFCTTVETFSINIEGFGGIINVSGSLILPVTGSPSLSESIVGSLSPSKYAGILVPSGLLTVTITLFCMAPLSTAACSIIYVAV